MDGNSWKPASLKIPNLKLATNECYAGRDLRTVHLKFYHPIDSCITGLPMMDSIELYVPEDSTCIIIVTVVWGVPSI